MNETAKEIYKKILFYNQEYLWFSRRDFFWKLYREKRKKVEEVNINVKEIREENK